MADWSVTNTRADGTTASAEFRDPEGHSHFVEAHANCEVATDSTCWLAAALLLAMHSSADSLHVEGPVDPVALRNAGEVQQALTRWFPNDFHLVTIDAPTASANPASSGVGLFFTGGLDSFHSLIRRHDDVTHLIYAVGFDLNRDEHPELVEQTVSAIAQVAEEKGLVFLTVDTNLRQVGDSYGLDWYRHFHGAALAFVAHLFSTQVGRVIISSSDPEELLSPAGTHPELDPWWSSTDVEFEHYGVAEGRIQKAALVATDASAMKHLRVCYRNPNGAYNCGRCEKCLRTQVNLRIVGAEGRCETLPRRTDLLRVITQPLDGTGYDELYVNLRGLSDSQRSDPALWVALRASLVKSRFADALRTSPVAPLVRRAKRALQGAR